MARNYEVVVRVPVVAGSPCVAQEIVEKALTDAGLEPIVQEVDCKAIIIDNVTDKDVEAIRQAMKDDGVRRPIEVVDETPIAGSRRCDNGR